MKVSALATAIVLCTSMAQAATKDENPHWWIKSDGRCEAATLVADREKIPEFADPDALAKLTDAKVEATPDYTVVYPYQGKKGDLVVVYLPSREQCEKAQVHHDDAPAPVAAAPVPAPEPVTAPAEVTAPADPAHAGQPEPVTASEFNCISHHAQDDFRHNIALSVGQQGQPLGKASPDPIAECQISDTHVASAMDELMNFYQSWHGGLTWVETNCHAEAAIPRNKWVCTEGDVTQEYR